MTLEKNEMIKDPDEFEEAQENLIQWGIPFKVLFKSRFALFFFSFLFSHYFLTFQQLVKTNHVLDVGCGMGLPVKCLKRLGVSARFIGVDIHSRYLKKVKRSGFYDDCVLANVCYLPFKKDSFDSVMCLQVLEHLSQRDGIITLDYLSNVGSKVILTTPVGFVENDISSANLFQDHKSGWWPGNLRDLGYEVRGYGGVRMGKLGRFKPFLAFNVIFAPMLIYVPALAFHMFAVKNKRK
jgi:SAM-dependent methyltransferase